LQPEDDEVVVVLVPGSGYWALSALAPDARPFVPDCLPRATASRSASRHPSNRRHSPATRYCTVGVVVTGAVPPGLLPEPPVTTGTTASVGPEPPDGLVIGTSTVCWVDGADVPEPGPDRLAGGTWTSVVGSGRVGPMGGGRG
jgi:hypothetical protein